MDFILGCNYWASNAGADMWRDFDAECIDEDLRALSGGGVTHMRVFPNWRDFQPVMPLLRGHGILDDYCMEGEAPAENPYYLSEVMLERFNLFLDLCDKYRIKVIVGLITGWMSGRLYVPSALYGKDVLTDPTAIYFEQLFIRGFVSRFKSRDTIYAWDLGNECNCMGDADRIRAVNWTATIANAIRAEDASRPVVSGMHGIEASRESAWQIRDQATWNDILTTHPYPFWCAHTRNDRILSLRTTMHATAQNKYYSECGGRPCLAEEIGTMGPMLASNDAAADFMRTNLFSLWSNDAVGVMWWCAHEQTMLSAFPYSTNMVELELGLLNADRSPKPVMKEIGRFKEFLCGLDFELPPADTDAVCLLTQGQKQWGICYTSHVLARLSGLNFRYAYADDGIPEAENYIMPSVNGITVMNARYFKELKERIAEGANLYISMDNGVLSEFEKLTGLRVIDSYQAPETKSFTLGGRDYTFTTKRTYLLESVGADVIARDNTGNPVLSVYKYGKGTVTYLNFPLEENLIDGHDAFSDGDHEIYRYIFAPLYSALPIKVEGDGVYTTYHGCGDTVYAVAVNHSPDRSEIRILSDVYKPTKVYHGGLDAVDAWDSSVIKLEKI